MNMAQAFNEWMRRYIEEPERFEREWQEVEKFKGDAAAEIGPRYGQRCAAYLRQLMRVPQMERLVHVPKHIIAQAARTTKKRPAPKKLPRTPGPREFAAKRKRGGKRR